uniref:WD repeat-containing protein 17-like n=1 Tax=Saccoglossus kowalevskii TaxID=10224 RepID=A0ABM0MAC7_SACKO|nr:PREDICTED: WD repeat-containing protein 17-like [Saccoglossus kowalevskii]
MSKLIRGNELELAISVGLSLNVNEHCELTYLATELLAKRCEKISMWELAVDLLKTIPVSELPLVKICARCTGSMSEINDLHAKAGLPNMEECLFKAESCHDNILEAIKYFILSPSPELALDVGLPEIKAKMSKTTWKVHDVKLLLDLLSSIRTDKLKQQKCARLFCTRDSVDLLFSEKQINAELDAWRAHKLPIVNSSVCHNKQNPSEEQKRLYATILERTESLTCSVGIGCDLVTGSHLPSHSDVHSSYLTGNRIQGPAFFLEDGRQAISLNDALMWAKVNPFSPLGSGALINPF